MNWLWRASVVCAVWSTGCASGMNGMSDKLMAESPTTGARVFVDGFDATRKAVVVPNDRPHIVLVRAPGYADRVVALEPHVRALPIVLDVLLAVPSFLIAPLVDLGTGFWSGVDSPGEPVALAPAVAMMRARPTYGAAHDRPEAVLASSRVAVPSVAAPAAAQPTPPSLEAAPVVGNAPAVVSVSPPSRPSKVSCDPNFELDEQGRKHFKPACFLGQQRSGRP